MRTAPASVPLPPAIFLHSINGMSDLKARRTHRPASAQDLAVSCFPTTLEVLFFPPRTWLRESPLKKGIEQPQESIEAFSHLHPPSLTCVRSTKRSRAHTHTNSTCRTRNRGEGKRKRYRGISPFYLVCLKKIARNFLLFPPIRLVDHRITSRRISPEETFTSGLQRLLNGHLMLDHCFFFSSVGYCNVALF